MANRLRTLCHSAQRLKVRVLDGQGQFVAIQLEEEGILNKGDNVAIRGAESLQQGQRVEIRKKNSRI